MIPAQAHTAMICIDMTPASSNARPMPETAASGRLFGNSRTISTGIQLITAAAMVAKVPARITE